MNCVVLEGELYYFLENLSELCYLLKDLGELFYVHEDLDKLCYVLSDLGNCVLF